MFLPTVYFVSDGSSACSFFLDSLKHNHTFRKLKLDVSEMESIGNKLTSGEPSAVILPVTPSIIELPYFVECVRKITQTMDEIKGTAFRCYIYPIDMTYDEFKARCDNACRLKGKKEAYNEALYLIQDYIHHAEFSSVDELGNEVKNFIKHADEIKNFYYARNVELFLKSGFGFLLQTLTIISHITTISFGILFSKFITHIIPQLNALHQEALLLLNGKYVYPVILTFSIAAIFSITNTIYWLKNGAKHFIRQMESSKTAWLSFGYGIILCIPVFALFINIYDQHMGFILLSIASGFLVDIMRRNRYEASRQKAALKKVIPNDTTKIERRLLNSHSEFSDTPWRIPYLSKEKRPVFISYTHASAWAQNMADLIYNELKQRDIPCFLDKYNIARGSSWHNRLKEKMDSASIIISLVDELSINNRWPAEELETAIRLRSISGSPNVYVLLKQELDVINLKKMPIFEEIIHRAGSDKEIAFVLKETENSAKLISSQIARIPESVHSIFGYHASVIIDKFRIPINWLSITIQTTLGIPIAIAALVNWKTGFFETQISNSDTNAIIYLFSACFIATVSAIDLFERIFILKPINTIKYHILISPILSLPIAIGTIAACLPYLHFSFEIILWTFLCFGTAICSITACNKNGVRMNHYQYRNEID